MARAITKHAKAAKMIRQELKKHGIKATVKSESYSMGSSINIRIMQDLLPAAIKQIKEFADQFQQGHFNGMEDIYEYSNSRDDLPFISSEYSTSTICPR